MRRAVTFLVVLLAGGACGGPSDDIKGACNAAQAISAVRDRADLQAQIDEMHASKDDKLDAAARDFENAVREDDQAKAQAAVGRFFDRCDDLGVDTLPEFESLGTSVTRSSRSLPA